MNRLIDWIMSLSRGMQIALAGVAVLIIFGGGWYFLFGGKQADAEVERPNISADFPDAEIVDLGSDKLKDLKRASSQQSVNDYWESLEAQDVNSGGLMGSGALRQSSDAASATGAALQEVYLDPAVYTKTEIERINLGIETKESIDARKAALAEMKKENERQGRRLTQEQQDSIYFARMERAYGIAMKMGGAEPESEPVDAEVVPEPEEEDASESVEPEVRSLPSVSVSADDVFGSISSSWDTPSGLGASPNGSSFTPSPAKATFLRTETLVNGQRVTMRLMEDLTLSDGTVIPANTHVKGTCRMSSRLNITVSTISYGGRIYYVNLDVYDNDGTEGIYCPVIAESRGAKAGKEIASTALSGVASTAATLFTRSATLGRVVRQGIGEISGSIDGNGNVTVKVSSGYEFYVFEEIN